MCKKSTLLIMIAVIAFGFVVGSSQLFAQSQPKPVYGGVLKISTINDAAALYPPKNTRGTDSLFLCTSVEALFRYDEAGRPGKPWLATGHTVSPDLKSVTITLRKGVKFHDGSDFNAKVVKVNLEASMAERKAGVRAIKSIDIIDDHTVRLNLTKFENTLISYLGSHPGYMVSAKAIREHDTDWLLSHPVGTGPFKLVEWERDVHQKYERFDGYWQKGKPYLEGIEWVFIADPMTALASFEAGEAHMLIDVAAENYSKLVSSGKYNVTVSPKGFLGFAPDSTTQGSPFADIRVRRAIQYAIDKKAIADGLGHGLWAPTDQPAMIKGWAYNKDVVGYSYDPDKTKRLLKEAGYSKGFKTKLFIQSRPREHVTMFTAVQGFLGEVGIDVEIVLLERQKLLQMIMKGKGWEKGLIWLPMGTGHTLDEAATLNQFVSQRSPGYKLMFKPDDIEKTLRQALGATDFAKKQGATREIMKLIVDKHSEFFMIVSLAQNNIRFPLVHDVGMFVNSSRHQWTPADAWLSR